MNFEKKQQPVAVCTVCGAYGHSVKYIDVRCGKPLGGNRCAGIRGDARNKKYWKECPKCNATGHFAKEECPMCYGKGWFYIKPTEEVPA